MRALLVAGLLGFSSPALADGGRISPVDDPLVRKECGECHMAFQPGFLPARSWERLMDGLADHFGEDVGLPAEKSRLIRARLVAGAADRTRGGLAAQYLRWVASEGRPLRITENPSFRREHNFPDRVWADSEVVARSNCPACHPKADQGWYDDD